MLNRFKYFVLGLLVILVSLGGFFLGRYSIKNSNKEVDDEIVVEAIRNSFNNINVRNNEGDISDIKLVCQNGMRYLYSFHYENYDYEEMDNTNDFAIEMIIDKETNYYYVENLEMYFNRYNDKCLNLFE